MFSSSKFYYKTSYIYSIPTASEGKDYIWTKLAFLRPGSIDADKELRIAVRQYRCWFLLRWNNFADIKLKNRHFFWSSCPTEKECFSYIAKYFISENRLLIVQFVIIADENPFANWKSTWSTLTIEYIMHFVYSASGFELNDSNKNSYFFFSFQCYIPKIKMIFKKKRDNSFYLNEKPVFQSCNATEWLSCLETKTPKCFLSKRTHTM